MIQCSLHEFSLIKIRLLQKLWIWWKLKLCHFYHKTVGCHSIENKYKWQNSMSVIHPELTNIAPGKIFAELYNVKGKRTLEEKWQTFTCEKSPVMVEGKNNLKTRRKKKCKLILLGLDHIFLTNGENFFSHSTRRESWTQPKCPVWKITTTMKNCVHKLGKTQCLIFNFFFRKYDNYKNRTDVMSLSNIIFDTSWSFVKPALFYFLLFMS